jgi:hypothetical protein
VKFTEDVLVTGIPFIQLETGAIKNKAFFKSNLNSSTILFTYTISAGDSSLDLDYFDTNALVSGLNLIKGLSGIPANVTLAAPGVTGSLGFQSNIVINTIKPVIVSFASTTPDGTYGAGVQIPMQIFVNRSVILAGGTLAVKLNSGATVNVSSINGLVIDFIYVTKLGDSANDLNISSLSLSSGASILDSQGNALNLSLPASPQFADNHEIKINAVAIDFIVTASSGANGSVSPLGSIPVKAGSTLSFTIKAENNFHIADVLVDGLSVGPASEYIFTNIQANHTISATFAVNNGFFEITANAGLGGSLSNSGIIKVAEGSAFAINIFADAGFHITDIVVDGKSVGNVKVYSFANIVSNHHLEAVFARDTHKYLVTSNFIGQGEITPIGHQLVLDGSDLTFKIQASVGYHLRDVIVDGKSIGVVDTYKFTNIFDNHQILAVFEKTLPVYTIVASAIGGGSISPIQLVKVEAGKNQEFTFTPQDGFHLSRLLVDGKSQALSNEYSFINVNKNHTIEAIFQSTKSKYKTGYCINNGGIGAKVEFSPSSEVESGSSLTILITAETDYQIQDIRINSNSINGGEASLKNKTKNKVFGSSVVYKIDNVQDDYLVEVDVDKIKTTHTININKQGKGSFDVEAIFVVDDGATQPINFKPAEGYHVGNVILNGESIGPIQYLSLINIKSNQEITATFVKDQTSYSVNSGVWGKGKISPSGQNIVLSGESLGFTFTPDKGYQLVDLIIDGISLNFSSRLGYRDGYMFTNVIMNHSINAVYKEIKTSYKITTKVGLGGTATNSGVVSVAHEANHLIQITADAGYHVEDVNIDGKSLGGISGYEFISVNSDHLVDIKFGVNKTNYNVIINSGEGGKVSPGTFMQVVAGDSQVIAFIPDAGYRVLNVTVNGLTKGPVSSVLLRNIQKDQIVSVTFVESDKLFTVNAVVIGTGGVSSLGTSGVKNGGSITYDFQPTDNSTVVDVKVDGISYGILNTYTFTNVSEDHTIAYIVEAPVATAGAENTSASSSSSGGCQYAASASNSSAIELVFLLLFIMLSTRLIRKEK